MKDREWVMGESGAVISECSNYRYVLWRVWDKDSDYLNFIGINPSTADGMYDDRTVAKLVQFAQLWGCGGLIVSNLYSYRSTNVKALRAVIDPIGPCNHDRLHAAALACSSHLVGWGNHGLMNDRDLKVMRYLTKYVDHFKPLTLGVNKNGTPKHPLYCPLIDKPFPYEGRRFYENKSSAVG